MDAESLIDAAPADGSPPPAGPFFNYDALRARDGQLLLTSAPSFASSSPAIFAVTGK